MRSSYHILSLKELHFRFLKKSCWIRTFPHSYGITNLIFEIHIRFFEKLHQTLAMTSYSESQCNLKITKIFKTFFEGMPQN